MQGRADRCRLAHRAVAEVLLGDFYRGEQQGNGRAGQQVLDAQPGRQADAAVAQPGVNGAPALVEGHRLPGFVAECGDRDGVQVLLIEGFVDAAEVQVAVEQLAQG
ncbi:hypothetical protein D3C76_1161490 [compost metagenome]